MAILIDSLNSIGLNLSAHLIHNYTSTLSRICWKARSHYRRLQIFKTFWWIQKLCPFYSWTCFHRCWTILWITSLALLKTSFIVKKFTSIYQSWRSLILNRWAWVLFILLSMYSSLGMINNVQNLLASLIWILNYILNLFLFSFLTSTQIIQCDFISENICVISTSIVRNIFDFQIFAIKFCSIRIILFIAIYYLRIHTA